MPDVPPTQGHSMHLEQLEAGLSKWFQVQFLSSSGDESPCTHLLSLVSALRGFLQDAARGFL